MSINGIEFSETFLKSFPDAETFLKSSPCVHFINRRIITENALINFFNKITSNDDKIVQPGSSEDKPSESITAGGGRKKGSNSQPASNSI